MARRHPKSIRSIAEAPVTVSTMERRVTHATRITVEVWEGGKLVEQEKWFQSDDFYGITFGYRSLPGAAIRALGSASDVFGGHVENTVRFRDTGEEVRVTPVPKMLPGEIGETR